MLASMRLSPLSEERVLTGVGIPGKNINRIFENGFSTKGTGRGTGLYQVKAMVERFGGTITVESQEGVGTSFSVSFTK